MSERPEQLPDWPEQWEVVATDRRGLYPPCPRCCTETALARRCYEADGEWTAEVTTVCPNGCLTVDDAEVVM